MIVNNLISQAASLSPTGAGKANMPSAADTTKSFGQFLSDALDSVAAQDNNAQRVTGKFMVGQADVSEVMIASQQAELSLQLTTQVRNKVIEAYQEIMRTQV